ncbi:MAG: hypothetical protein ACYTBJ_18790 [Planctomycetota bacterium]|jgi:hypothetical protein
MIIHTDPTLETNEIVALQVTLGAQCNTMLPFNMGLFRRADSNDQVKHVRIFERTLSLMTRNQRKRYRKHPVNGGVRWV